MINAADLVFGMIERYIALPVKMVINVFKFGIGIQPYGAAAYGIKLKGFFFVGLFVRTKGGAAVT